jgi:hypothetical protein
MNIPFGVRLAFSIAVPLLIVNRGYKKKSLNFSGALSSLVVGFLLTFTNLCFFSALLAFFVSGSFVTKLKADVKRDIEYDFKEGTKCSFWPLFTVSVFCSTSKHEIEAGNVDQGLMHMLWKKLQGINVKSPAENSQCYCRATNIENCL